MRKFLKILLLLLPALLVLAAVFVRVRQEQEIRHIAAREAALSARLDSAASALEGFRMRDSSYRTAAKADSLAETAPVLPGSPVDSLLEAARALSPVLRQTLALSREAEARLRCIPSICPLAAGTFQLTARFGNRTDPIEGDTRLHEGLDLACPQGNPVYVTGDGVVEMIDNDIFGYGNSIIVNHGYGYKTRYAHLKLIRTSENIRLKRGDLLGETGVSGRATGPHLHYEVLFNGEPVDPEQFMQLEK